MDYPPLDSLFYSNPVYLYSWQDRDKTKIEFTVIQHEGELGLKIVYIILGENDKLISATQVAGRGNEGGYWFETKTKFITNDTLLQIGAITKWWDEVKMKKMDKTIGDSTFTQLYIGSNGKITEKLISQNNELNF